MFRYGFNLITDLWEVMLDGIVMRHFETEEECEKWIKEQMKGREIE